MMAENNKAVAVFRRTDGHVVDIEATRQPDGRYELAKIATQVIGPFFKFGRNWLLFKRIKDPADI